jgi:fused signal recognition particle receptor
MARLFRRDGDAPKKSLWQRIKEVATTDVGVILRGGVKEGSLEQLEEVLLAADFGVPTTLQLVDKIGGYAQQGFIRTEAEFQDALRRLVEAELPGGEQRRSLNLPAERPAVILVVGVNGAGKTTFIGKLATRLRKQGKRRSRRARRHVPRRRDRPVARVGGAQRRGLRGAEGGRRPAAVAFDAVDAGVTRGADVVIIDTAGRLHTSGGLMEEMKKVHRVVAKRLPERRTRRSSCSTAPSARTRCSRRRSSPPPSR